MAGHVDQVGQHVGEYRILRWLGGGGFGDVYLGEHLHEHTQVAIKVLHGRLTRHDDLKEFINEARTIHLKHPHIVSLLDFGISSDNTPFLVMTYAPHGTLRDRHPKGSQLPLSIIVSYVQQLASALQYAHSLHLVHRDVKPENMLVGSSHEILLSDFGIAAIVHSSRSLATENGIGGTLPYMAPEQIAGKPRTSSDQYALGIVVYEWITGRRPFTGIAAEVAMQHITTPPSSLREQIPMLPIDVEQVVLKALAKDSKNRYADIEAFANALEQASQQAETLNPPLERSLSVRSSLPVQVPITALPPTKQVNVVNPASIDTRFAPIPADSFSRVEEMALVKKPVDGLAASPTIPLTIHKHSRQKPTLLLLPPTASIEIPQSLHRRRHWRSATLLLALALLILGSAWGLYATVHNSTTRTVATATANAHTTSDSGAGSLNLVNIKSSPSSGPVCDTTATANAHATSDSGTGSLVSCPSSGPVGATISVSGSGWPEPDGEQVTLGYMIAAFCSTVPDSQASTFKSGSFSGSFHLPGGTPLGTYSICANFGSTTAIANTFTVLTESSPHISISLPIQPAKQQATVSGSNYFPSGTTVNLSWETTNGNVIFTITPAVSNSSGLISRTFLIPTSIASGSYKIVATISGQPTLTSSATFTYNAPTTS